MAMELKKNAPTMKVYDINLTGEFEIKINIKTCEWVIIQVQAMLNFHRDVAMEVISCSCHYGAVAMALKLSYIYMELV